MANEENLIPQAHKLTVDEQSKGGKVSAQKRAAKKRQHENWKELGEMFFPMATKKGKLTEIKKISDFEKANITAEEMIFFSLLKKAMNGDIAAINQLFTMTGWDKKMANAIQSADEKADNDTGTSLLIKALEGKASEVWNEENDNE